jgi:antitoxin component of RelBE/YafQ-DinJ toxin-antitoxin module
MTKLNQIVAVEKGEKARALTEETVLHREVQKTPLLAGISRTYKPKDDDGDQLPAESTRVQVNAEDILEKLGKTLTNLFDITLTKEVANTKATADVVVDGKTLIKGAPVTYLLFLEKQLINLRTFVAKLPILDPAENWTKDPNTGAWATDPTQTVKTKKVPKNWVKAEATDRHPAQVEIFHEDVIQGTWTTVKFSGALPQTRVAELTERVDALIKAVKFAREEANNADVDDTKAAKAVFDYLLK